jgi:hypothetical protein
MRLIASLIISNITSLFYCALACTSREQLDSWIVKIGWLGQRLKRIAFIVKIMIIYHVQLPFHQYRVIITIFIVISSIHFLQIILSIFVSILCKIWTVCFYYILSILYLRIFVINEIFLLLFSIWVFTAALLLHIVSPKLILIFIIDAWCI